MWRRGTSVLRYIGGSGPPVLVVPSLVNRAHVVTLGARGGFATALIHAGFEVFVVDWQEPGRTERTFSSGGYVQYRLLPALRWLLATRNTARAHVIGYCMGGLLALGMAGLAPQAIARLALIATPWDFHAERERIGAQALRMLATLTPELGTYGILSAQRVHELLAILSGMEVIRKFQRFAARSRRDSARTGQFVALEDWLSDGVALSAPVARECLGDWYGANRLMEGSLQRKGLPDWLRPDRVTAPVLVVRAMRDRLVPPSAQQPLLKVIPHAQRMDVALGHLGLMVSPRAGDRFWQPLSAWLRGEILGPRFLARDSWPEILGQ